LVLAKSLIQTNGKVAKFKGVSKTNLERWQTEFDKSPRTFGQDLRKINNGRKVKFPELDDHLKV